MPRITNHDPEYDRAVEREIVTGRPSISLSELRERVDENFDRARPTATTWRAMRLARDGRIIMFRDPIDNWTLRVGRR